MRIEKVVLVGFGALRDAALEFAPGMTVVYGLNESAKTTFHAGIYAGLCGVRRARGAPAREDRAFAELHKPWDGGAWKVISVVRLADGRRIELTHELDGGVGSTAIDLPIGRDVSNEILYDGSPDGSRWLGFTRRSFVTTACVKQAQIASVLRNAEALQDELQRAAATAGRDETAAAAIERLQDFFRDNVGRDQRNSTRPLRTAIAANEAAAIDLRHAQEAHAEYMQGFGRFEELERELERKVDELRLHQAAAARAAAGAADARATRARELSERYPAEPRGAAGESTAANDVATALTLWDNRPSEPDLTGMTVEELESELSHLPEKPEGDLVPAQAVLNAETTLRAVEQALKAHEQTATPAQHQARHTSRSRPTSCARSRRSSTRMFRRSMRSRDAVPLNCDARSKALTARPIGFSSSFRLRLRRSGSSCSPQRRSLSAHSSS